MISRAIRRLATRVLVVLALVLLCPARASWASVAGTGTFGIAFHGQLPNPSFDGTFVFGDDPGSLISGDPVDLSTVGTMTFTGTVTGINLGALSADFELTATDSAGGALLSFTASGTAVCSVPTCAGGTATLVGPLVVTGGTVLPQGDYTLDGTLALNISSTLTGTGVFGINAFPATPLPAGTDVEASSGNTTFFDSIENDVSRFSIETLFSVVPNDVILRFIPLSIAPGALPPGIKLNVEGYDSVFVDLQTIPTDEVTAFLTPRGIAESVRVCFRYDDELEDGIVDGTTVAVDRLRVLHSADGAFVDVTIPNPSSIQQVCGQVTSLSPFVVGVADETPETTTTTSAPPTTVVTTTTTTTSAPPTTVVTTTTTTTSPLCGNGVVDEGEGCDTGSPGSAILCGPEGTCGDNCQCEGTTTTSTTAPPTTSTSTTTTTSAPPTTVVTTTTTTSAPPTTVVTTTTTTTTTSPLCGNGVVDEGEGCDTGSPGSAILCGPEGTCGDDCQCEEVPTTTTTTSVPPTTVVTTTTTTSTSTTTSTTLPACTEDAPTYASILCRLDQLILLVNGSSINDPTKGNLLNALNKARTRTVESQNFDLAKNTKKAKRRLKSAARRLVFFEHRVDSLTGGRNIPDELEPVLQSDSSSIREDMITLAASL